MVQVELRGATLGRRGAPVLSDVSLTARAGEFLVFSGPSGGGKSTLLASVLGLLPPLAGDVRCSATRRALVPQHDRLDDLLPVSVLELVLSGAPRERSWMGRPSAAACARARGLLGGLDLADYAERRFGALSGGQRQRALVARALVGQPEVVAFDEATSALDQGSAERVVRAATEAAAGGALVLWVTHQPLVGVAARRFRVADGGVREE